MHGERLRDCMGIICSKSEGFGIMVFRRSGGLCAGKGRIKVRYPFLFHLVLLSSLLLTKRFSEERVTKSGKGTKCAITVSDTKLAVHLGLDSYLLLLRANSDSCERFIYIAKAKTRVVWLYHVYYSNTIYITITKDSCISLL